MMQLEMLPAVRAANLGKPGTLRIGEPANRPEAKGQPAAGGSQPSSQQQRQEEADADLANQLQAQLNAQQARGGGPSRSDLIVSSSLHDTAKY